MNGTPVVIEDLAPEWDLEAAQIMLDAVNYDLERCPDSENCKHAKEVILKRINELQA